MRLSLIMKKIERVPTYIPGLDELIEGGIPKGATLLVSGTAGSGKTILSLQYLYEGIVRNEKGVFISFEMMPEQLVAQAEQFGWDLKKYMDNNVFRIYYYDLNNVHVSTVLKDIQDIINTFNPSRLVIDSLTILGVYAELIESSEIYEMLNLPEGSMIPSNAITRRTITNLIRMLDNHPVTSIVTSELAEGSQWLSRDTISEFICDGVLLLKTQTVGRSLSRTIEIRKMRLTNIKGGEYGFTFTRNGIVLNV